MVIDSTGNFGLGITNPTNTLTINGADNDTTPILGLRSGNSSIGINDGAQIAFGYDGTDDYQHFIQTRHNGVNSNNAIDFYVCDGTPNNTLTSGSVHTMSLVSGSVGIGITNPESTLHLKTTSGGTDLLLQTGAGLDNSITFREDTKNYFRILHEGSAGLNPNNLFKIQCTDGNDGVFDVDAITIKQSGNVGIGTTNPTSTLTNFGSFATGLTANTLIVTDDSDGIVRVGPSINSTGTGRLNIQDRTGTYISFYTSTTLRSRINSVSSGDIALEVGGTERLRILQSNEYIGIGTTTPGSTLAVGGTITELYNGTYWNVVTQADVGYGASQVPLNQYLGQLAFLDDYHPNGLRRDGGGSDDVFVDSNGLVGINTTSPTSTLDVNGTLNVAGISTFASDIDINASVDISNNLVVDGLSDLDELNVAGISTFQNNIEVTGNIEFDNITTTGAATTTLTTLTETPIHTGLSASTYRSVEYTIQATEGTNFHSAKVLVVHDGTTAYHSEYGTIYNNTPVATFNADVSGGNLRLLAAGESSNSTVYKIHFIATKV